jgi:hypothetical protein
MEVGELAFMISGGQEVALLPPNPFIWIVLRLGQPLLCGLRLGLPETFEPHWFREVGRILELWEPL